MLSIYFQGRELDTRTTVFKKKDIVYQLKMKASRRKFLHHTYIPMVQCIQTYIFSHLVVVCWLFFKINFIKKIFQEH